jgi:predicted hotdog family 3-hydroxylacyl-ACP dehydratase
MAAAQAVAEERMNARTAPVIVEEQREGGTCTLQLLVPADLDYFPGHFPQAPVLPGAAQIGWALQLAASRLDTTPHCREMEALKFQRILRPGDCVTLTLCRDDARGKLRFAYHDGETPHSSGRLVLATLQEARIGGRAPATTATQVLPLPMAELLPHAGEMIQLDAVLEHGPEHALCRRRVPAGGLFHDAGGNLPAWMGVELMAQAIAAWAGCRAKAAGEPVRPGLLLGTRHYACNVAAFAPGSELRVEARRDFHDDSGMAVFTCRIQAAGVLAEARLSVFSPPGAGALFQSPATQP